MFSEVIADIPHSFCVSFSLFSLSLPVPFLESPKYAPQRVESGHALSVNMSLPHPHPLLRAKSENTMATPPEPVAPPMTAPATTQVEPIPTLLPISVAGL